MGLLSQCPTHTCTLQRLESQGIHGIIITEVLFLIFPMTLEQLKVTGTNTDKDVMFGMGVTGDGLS